MEGPGRKTHDRYDHRQQVLLSRILLSAWYIRIEFHTIQHLSRGPTSLWRGFRSEPVLRCKTNQRVELLYHDAILHWGFKWGKKDDSFNKGIPLSLSRFRVLFRNNYIFFKISFLTLAHFSGYFVTIYVEKNFKVQRKVCPQIFTFFLINTFSKLDTESKTCCLFLFSGLYLRRKGKQLFLKSCNFYSL